jgi:hypothetical protein
MTHGQQNINTRTVTKYQTARIFVMKFVSKSKIKKGEVVHHDIKLVGEGETPPIL